MLVLYDLLYLSLATALYGCAGWVGYLCGRSLPLWAGAPLGVLAALLTLIGLVAVLTALCPRLEPGRYTLVKGPVAVSWVLRSILRRILFLPSLKAVLFSSNVLRFLSLRALGARVAFNSNISSDVDILDPALFSLGRGATVGARSFIAGHFIADRVLHLREVRIGADALLALQVVVAPGCVIGERAVLKPGASLSVGVQVGAGAEIGIGALVDTLARIGDGAIVGTLAHVPPRARVEAGKRFEAAA
jgi:carbonic anhydrase/acetyltransferase-like protein (isoleucine patch superfamily)